MDEFIALLGEFQTSVYNPNVFCGIGAAIIVFVIEIILLRRYYKLKRNKKREQAIELGHVVKGTRVKKWDDDPYKRRQDSYFHATYMYVVDGTEYKYSYMGKISPPLTVDLYYLKNPKLVFSDLESKKEHFWVIIYIIPLAVAIWVINLLGGVGM